MTELRLESVTKRFGNTLGVDGLSLHVRPGELMTLLGPSGSGKTTALRLIAGYLDPDAGRILVGSREIHRLAPEKRDIGMVFQSYALFPHRNVAGNVAFGLERRKVPKKERDRRVAETLERVRLTGLERRLPGELSGGQQQRVALARALVIQPSLLLLDEPLSNLDAKLREKLRFEIRRIQKDLGITTLLVTHDQEEALTVSDRIALVHRGRLQQVGTPQELYHHPRHRFVADFVGKINWLRTKRVAPNRYRLTTGEEIQAPPGPEQALIGVRPELVRMGTPPPEKKANALAATLMRRVFLGELAEIEVALGDGSILLIRGTELGDTPTEPGAKLCIWWAVEQTSVVEDQ